MEERNDGGSAFPCEQGHIPNGTWNQTFEPGMTLRDYFAAKAMAALIAEPVSGSQSTIQYLTATEAGDAYAPGARIARAAYMMADAMLAARGARQQ